MKLFYKILFAPSLIIVFLSALVATAYWGLYSEKKASDTIYLRQNSIGNLQEGYQKMTDAQAKIYRLLAWSSTLAQDKVQEKTQQISKIIETAKEDFKKAESYLMTKELDDIQSMVGSYHETVLKGIELSAVDMNMGTMVMQSADESFSKLDNQLREIIKKYDLDNKKIKDDSVQAFNKSLVLFAVLSLMAIIVSFVVTVIIA